MPRRRCSTAACPSARLRAVGGRVHAQRVARRRRPHRERHRRGAHLSAALSRREQVRVTGAGDLLGVAPAMVELRRSVERAAAAPFAVLIDGESGSGKELVARAIHRGGPRRDRAFYALNCAAMPDDLVEAELFGHARGSFTAPSWIASARSKRRTGARCFCDEIGELSLRAQAKMLRVLQEGELRRVGDNVSRRIDVRIVAATNRDLRQEVAAGRFRLISSTASTSSASACRRCGNDVRTLRCSPSISGASPPRVW